ncbi:ATP synthase F1 subunit delta [Candidatus Dependentiae bacterium]
MQVRINLIAKKYALAFLNNFFGQLSDEDIDKLIYLQNFLKKNKLFYVYLRIPSLSGDIKQKAIDRLIKSFDLGEPSLRLIVLLLKEGRIEILDKVLSKIVMLYRFRKKIKLFNVASSHELSLNQQEKVIKFLKNMANGRVIAKFIVDKKLISGLRIQSDNFLWERSIAKQLRDVKRLIFKQVGLW